MKSLLILLLGSLPLAILTATTLLELRSIEADPAARVGGVDSPADAGAALKSREQLQGDKPLVEGLADVDLLTSETLPGLKDLPADSTLAPLKDAWTGWLSARQLAARSLNVPSPDDAADAERLQNSLKRLELLKAEYEQARPPGGEAFLALVDRQTTALKRRIEKERLQREAEAALAQARAEMQPKRYGACVSQCDQWLARYSELDATAVAEVRTLRDQARFRDEVERMSQQWQATDSLAGQLALLEGFLEKYPLDASRTASEQQIVERCRDRLAKLKAQLQEQETSRKGAESLRRLEENPPSELSERLQAAAEIRQSYPTDELAEKLRRTAVNWLAQALAEKQTGETDGILETETKQGQIVRGFFRKTVAPDGALVGYQHFPTYQQYRNPVAQVGTYAREDLLAAPGASVPRQCASQYNTMRAELLEQPARRASWEKLASACEQFDIQLAAYRRKPGSSDEQLEFRAEAAVARQIVAPAAWSNIEKLFGRGSQ